MFVAGREAGPAEDAGLDAGGVVVGVVGVGGRVDEQAAIPAARFLGGGELQRSPLGVVVQQFEDEVSEQMVPFVQ